MPDKDRELLVVYLPKPMIQWLREDAWRNGDIPSRSVERVLEKAGIGEEPRKETSQ